MEEFFSGQLLFSVLITGSMYALVALGLNLVYATMRLLNIAHGEIVMIGAYVGFWFFTLLGIGPLVSCFIAAAVTALFGVTVYLALFRRVLASPKLSARIESNSLLLFFGISIIAQNAMALLFSANARSYRYLDGAVHFGDVSVAGKRLVALYIASAACVAITAFLRLSQTGHSVRALIQNREAAAIVGVNVDRAQLVSLSLGFGSAGLAGALISMLEVTTPFMGFPFTITAFVVVILGGVGNLMGTLIAGFILAAIEIYGIALTSTNYRSILIYGVFITVLMVCPRGLFGRRASR